VIAISTYIAIIVSLAIEAVGDAWQYLTILIEVILNINIVNRTGWAYISNIGIIKFDVIRLNHKTWIVSLYRQKIIERINFDLNICAKNQSIIRLLVNKCFSIVIILFYLYKFRGLKEYKVIRDHLYCKIS
jgi:hypothetical protein